jgi:hypothetical protein
VHYPHPTYTPQECIIAYRGCLQVLTSSTNPCQSVPCGPFGTCFKGVCECNPASGYTGPSCEVAPSPVDAVYGPWSAPSPCSRSCGEGIMVSTRQCTPPRFGGLPCDVNATTETRMCNEGPCTAGVVNGGFSEWSAWSQCSQSCPGDRGGFFVGVQQRSRTCTNPVPSGTGADCAGDTQQTSGCYLAHPSPHHSPFPTFPFLYPLNHCLPRLLFSMPPGCLWVQGTATSTYAVLA